MTKKHNTVDAILSKEFRYPKSISKPVESIKIDVLKFDIIKERFISIHPVSLILDENKIINNGNQQ